MCACICPGAYNNMIVAIEDGITDTYKRVQTMS
jgi:hypothetical protein